MSKKYKYRASEARVQLSQLTLLIMNYKTLALACLLSAAAVHAAQPETPVKTDLKPVDPVPTTDTTKDAAALTPAEDPNKSKDEPTPDPNATTAQTAAATNTSTDDKTSIFSFNNLMLGGSGLVAIVGIVLLVVALRVSDDEEEL